MVKIGVFFALFKAKIATFSFLRIRRTELEIPFPVHNPENSSSIYKCTRWYIPGHRIGSIERLFPSRPLTW